MNKLTNLELQFLVNLLEINNHPNLDKTEINDRYYDIILNDIIKYHKNNKKFVELLKLKHKLIKEINVEIFYTNFGNDVADIDEREEGLYKFLDQQNLMIDLILANPGCYSKLITNNTIDKLKK